MGCEPCPASKLDLFPFTSRGGYCCSLSVSVGGQRNRDLQVYTEAEPFPIHALKLPHARQDEPGVDIEEDTLLLCVLTVI